MFYCKWKSHEHKNLLFKFYYYLLSRFIFKICGLSTPGYIKVFMLEKKRMTWEFLYSVFYFFILITHKGYSGLEKIRFLWLLKDFVKGEENLT